MLTSFKATKKSVYDGSVQSEETFNMAGDGNYAIQNIDGLGPVKSDVNTYDTPLDPGVGLLGTHTAERNIVITFGYNPDYANNNGYSPLRQALQTLFMPGQRVTLAFTDDILGVLTIDGTVESNEPSVFASEPTSVVSIICDFPYYDGADGLVTVPVTTEQFTIHNPGDVPIGFRFGFDIATARPAPVSVGLLNTVPSTVSPGFQFTLGGLSVNDHVEMSSIKGARGVTYVQSGVTKNGVGYFLGSLVDTFLYPGDNKFDFIDFSWAKNIYVQYERKYGGM